MNITYNAIVYNVDDPNICPHCHVVNKPSRRYCDETRDSDDSPAYISVWECANIKCNKLFIALYKIKNGSPTFVRFLNGLPKGPDWPQPILDLTSSHGDEINKSKFIKTYLQSLEAESRGLDELAGMGYRKAIEYLVKDWAIKEHSEEKENIEKSWLGAVIEKYYSGDLKEILARATWLGNDQAHYNKLFEEFDIEVLKELINLIMVEFDRQYKKDLYIQTITNRI
jgi:hypothetical protein